ncbi:MAG: hypothetical protein AAF604_04500 [Acidobacteriota bacterium]
MSAGARSPWQGRRRDVAVTLSGKEIRAGLRTRMIQRDDDDRLWMSAGDAGWVLVVEHSLFPAKEGER